MGVAAVLALQAAILLPTFTRRIRTPETARQAGHAAVIAGFTLLGILTTGLARGVLAQPVLTSLAGLVLSGSLYAGLRAWRERPTYPAQAVLSATATALMAAWSATGGVQKHNSAAAAPGSAQE